jgi:ParB family transcriptional regulator, chromosome partitioning protein
MAGTKSRLGRGLGGLISGGSASSRESGSKSGRSGGAAPKKKTSANSKAGREKAGPNSAPAPETVEVSGYREVPVARIDPNPYQPRKEFDEEHLRELMDSIRSEGLLQPIVVRVAGERFQLIAGERRWRACRELKMTRVPARVIEASDSSSASISLIENPQREGLNPIEEAMGYSSLIRDFDLTQEAVAERVGKGRATIANGLRLLHLEQEIQGYLSRGLLTIGHSKVLLGVEDGASRLLLARKVIEEGLSVRALEKAVEQHRRPQRNSQGSSRAVPAEEASAVRDLEKRISSALNARVELKHSPKKGKLIIEYLGNEDLTRLLEKIGINDSHVG